MLFRGLASLPLLGAKLFQQVKRLHRRAGRTLVRVDGVEGWPENVACGAGGGLAALNRGRSAARRSAFESRSAASNSASSARARETAGAGRPASFATWMP